VAGEEAAIGEDGAPKTTEVENAAALALPPGGL